MKHRVYGLPEVLYLNWKFAPVLFTLSMFSFLVALYEKTKSRVSYFRVSMQPCLTHI